MDYRFLVREDMEGISLVTLNRPQKRNALSRALRAEIVHCLEELEAEKGQRVVVLTGAGAVFCAGFDLSEFAGEDMETLFAEARSYHRKVYAFPKPLIAAINGAALAGGMDLAAMCDIRIASEGAVFGQPQVKRGIPAAYDLIRTVLPETIARELCLTGRQMDASEALRVGFINKTVKMERLVDESLAVAREVVASQGSLTAKAAFIKEQPRLFD